LLAAPLWESGSQAVEVAMLKGAEYPKRRALSAPSAIV
jgi:hypothetical protein